MCNNQQTGAMFLVQLQHQIKNLFRILAIEITRGLIGQDALRMCYQGARDRSTLPTQRNAYGTPSTRQISSP